ncbi:MAG: hypothetical protein P4M11_15235, partial [Candidatus Pacebacteria bacterium]|nr:hypothetical protein [Candidatus Paceibacterota bacterium]
PKPQNPKTPKPQPREPSAATLGLMCKHYTIARYKFGYNYNWTHNGKLQCSASEYLIRIIRTVAELT